MKQKNIWNITFGALLLGIGVYVLLSGRVLGRGGFTSMTAETHPTVFWIEVFILSGIGLLLLMHGITKTLGTAAKFSRIIDAAANKLLSRT